MGDPAARLDRITHHRGELCCGLSALGSVPESAGLIDSTRTGATRPEDAPAHRGG